MALHLLLIRVLPVWLHVLRIAEIPNTPTVSHEHQNALAREVEVTLKRALDLRCLYLACFHECQRHGARASLLPTGWACFVSGAFLQLFATRNCSGARIIFSLRGA